MPTAKTRRSLAKLKLRPKPVRPGDVAAARATATPGQLANQIAEVIVDRAEANGHCDAGDLRRAGFTASQIDRGGEQAQSLAQDRLAARALEPVA